MWRNPVNMSQKPTKIHGNTKEFDWDKLDKFLQCKPTLQFCAELMELSGRQIERKINDKFNMTYTEYRDMRMARVKFTVFQKMLQVAVGGKGNVPMLIFLSKNLLGYSDKIENKIEEVPTPELIAQAKDMIKQYEKEHEPIEDEELEN